ncbi:MAG: agmatinase [Firmicutes bacterium]|jgi:agmatinase|nr:agmatinase [Bacillota bacterium]
MEAYYGKRQSGVSLGDHIRRQGMFIGSNTDWEEARLAIIGAPMDCTTSFRPGTRFGPGRVREVSEGLEEYSPYLDRSLKDVAFYDVGDISVVFGDVDTTLARVRDVLEETVELGKIPVLIGGEHLVSLPAIEVLADRYEELKVLQFDAHADLRDEYLGQRLSHATVMRRVVERVGAENLYQFGIRSGTAEEFYFGHAKTHFHPDTILEPLRDSLTELGKDPIYVTIDIDVVDPAFAPGTGNPEPAGCTSRELMEAVHLFGCLNVVGVDIVELSPPLDHADITAILVAKLVREILLGIWPKQVAGLPQAAQKYR